MNEKTSKNRIYFYLIMFAILLLAGYYLFGTRNIHDNSGTVDNVRSGIEQGAESNSKLQEQLRSAESTADAIAGSVNAGASSVTNAERTAGTIASDLETAANSISKCQRIVDGIKQRNETATAQP